MLDKQHGGHALDEAKLAVHMAAKLEKARAQPGWEESSLRHNAAADALATIALESCRDLHKGMKNRAAAQTELEKAPQSCLRAQPKGYAWRNCPNARAADQRKKPDRWIYD